MQHAVELAELDRFLEMPVETRLSGSLQVFLLGITGEGDEVGASGCWLLA